MKLLLSLLLLGCALVSEAAQITGVRSFSSADSTRLVLEFDGPADFRVNEASTPGRLLVDLPQTTTTLEGPRWPARKGLIEAVRLDAAASVPRLVVDLHQEADAQVFALPGTPFRLVVDLSPRVIAVVARSSVPPVPVRQVAPALDVRQQATEPVPRKSLENQFQGKGRKMIVTIDAGHGGEDPGAIGPTGQREKMVTLAIAKALAEYLNTQDGITANLTRDTDFFIPLQQRRQIARYDRKADIFVSIHADSAPSRAARGSSVFALSLKGASTATSRFAQMLAEQENKSDLIGGIPPERDDLGGMLANMLVEGTLKHSLEMGRMILQQLEPTVGHLHSRGVEQAGFAVLKEPGMVSLLVETGFISNPDEEARLTDPDYQRQVARAVGDGVVRFCRQYPVPGTWFSRD